MILFDLQCDNGHRFEGWFGSSSDYADQKARGLLICPMCDSAEIAKAPMAPAIGAKGDRRARDASETSDRAREDRVPGPALSNAELSPHLMAALKKIATAQAKALEKSAWVGEKFVDEARSMHYGEKTEKPIHGKASLKEARDLIEEGITVMPLIGPIASPDELN
jgi:hypothetical protein